MEFAAERRLLAQDELAPVQQSHYPALDDLPHGDLLDLTRWLRARHGRARDIIRERRRRRSGKAATRDVTAEPPSERGLAAKKQVFARALKRANARLNQLAAAARREHALAFLHAALARKHATPPRHPNAGQTAAPGMRAQPSRKPRPVIQGARIGSTSQAVRNAQAARDAQ
ncbi:hypothetical protein [Limobrevibacterium gyesilva]